MRRPKNFPNTEFSVLVQYMTAENLHRRPGIHLVKQAWENKNNDQVIEECGPLPSDECTIS